MPGTGLVPWTLVLLQHKWLFRVYYPLSCELPGTWYPSRSSLSTARRKQILPSSLGRFSPTRTSSNDVSSGIPSYAHLL